MQPCFLLRGGDFLLPLLRYGLCLGSRRKRESQPRRIVIGSDSERAVQEKYWNLTHAEISLVLSALEGRLPSHEEYTLRQLNVRGWLISQSKRSSTAQFRGGCDAFLGRDHAGFSVGPFRRAGRPAHRHRSNGQSHGRYLPAAAKRHPAGGRFTAASPACVPADKHRRQAG